MSAASLPALLTVAEYENLPAKSGGRWELHHGEAVFVTFPKRDHKVLQRRLRKLLEELCEPRGYVVDTEYPYRPLPEHEVWCADVAVVNDLRDAQTPEWLSGSPELVVEVRSRSNTKAELQDKAMTTLAGEGSIEFWVVDPQPQTVTVYTRSSGMHLYEVAMSVPLPAVMSGAEVRVADMFI